MPPSPIAPHNRRSFGNPTRIRVLLLVLSAGFGGPAAAAPLDPGETVVTGALSGPVVLRALGSVAPTLSTCYRFALEKQPEAEGKLLIELHIDAAGKAGPAILQLSPALDVPGFRDCAAGAVANARFPPSTGPTGLQWSLSMAPDKDQQPLEALPEAVGPKGPPAKSLVPRPEQLKPTMRGELDPDVIRAVMARQMNVIRYCYGRAVMDNPTLQGKMTLSFVIGTTGSVVSASVAESTFPDNAVPSCVSARVMRVQFPPPKGGIVVVDWPFTFVPGSSVPG